MGFPGSDLLCLPDLLNSHLMDSGYDDGGGDDGGGDDVAFCDDVLMRQLAITNLLFTREQPGNDCATDMKIILLIIVTILSLALSAVVPIEILNRIQTFYPQIAGKLRPTSSNMHEIFKPKLNMTLRGEIFLTKHMEHANNEYYFPDFVEFLLRAENKDVSLQLIVGWCCTNGFSKLLEYIYVQFPEIVNSNFDLQRVVDRAKQGGHGRVLSLIDSWRVNSDFYLKFLMNVKAGRIAPLRSILQEMPDTERAVVIKGYNYEPCRLAVLNNKIDVVEEFKEWLGADAFRRVLKFNRLVSTICGNGHYKMLTLVNKWLTPKDFERILAKDNFESFHNAVSRGHVEILTLLRELSSEDAAAAMMRSKNYGAFFKAAELNQGDVLVELMKWPGQEQLAEAVQNVSKRMFTSASVKGHAKVLNVLKNFLPDNDATRMLIRETFCNQLNFGNIEILEMMRKLMNVDDVNEIIRADNYKVFSTALTFCRFGVLKYLADCLNEDEFKEMVRVNSQGEKIQYYLLQE